MAVLHLLPVVSVRTGVTAHHSLLVGVLLAYEQREQPVSLLLKLRDSYGLVCTFLCTTGLLGPFAGLPTGILYDGYVSHMENLFLRISAKIGIHSFGSS